MDLIFMDVMMPNMDGIEATKLIKVEQPKTMVVAISALDDKETSLKMVAAGCEDYVTKPFDSDILEQRIKNYFHLIDLRQDQSSSSDANDAINLFNKNVYHRALYFRIESELSLSQFWEYYLSDGILPVVGLHDHIRLLFAFGSWLIKANTKFRIYAEENKRYYYLTITGLQETNELVIRNIIAKSGVETSHILENGSLSFLLHKESVFVDEGAKINSDTPIEQEDKPKQKIAAEHYLKTLAKGYEQSVGVLFETEDAIDNLIMTLDSSANHDTLHALAISYNTYAKALKMLKEFDHLAYALVNLGKFLDTLEESSMNNSESLKMMVTLLLAILSDLSAWRIGIFSTKSAEDIHYWDQSLISAALQVEMLFNKDDQNDISEGEIEFF